MNLPLLETARLKLRGFTESDVPALVLVIGSPKLPRPLCAFHILMKKGMPANFSPAFRKKMSCAWQLNDVATANSAEGLGYILSRSIGALS